MVGMFSKWGQPAVSRSDKKISWTPRTSSFVSFAVLILVHRSLNFSNFSPLSILPRQSSLHSFYTAYNLSFEPFKFAIMSILPGPLYGLRVPAGEILIPASEGFPASVSPSSRNKNAITGHPSLGIPCVLNSMAQWLGLIECD